MYNSLLLQPVCVVYVSVCKPESIDFIFLIWSSPSLSLGAFGENNGNYVKKRKLKSIGEAIYAT